MKKHLPAALFCAGRAAGAGALAYYKAKAAGLGCELPTEWFLQNIRN